MIKKSVFLCVVLTVCVVSGSWADTRLEIQSSEAGKPPESQAVLVTTGKVRMEQSDPDDTVLLFYRDKSTFYAIEPSQKSYMEIDPAKAGAMMDEANEMRKQMMAQLEQQMAGMSEEQREQMRAMMGGMGQSMPEERPKVRYERRDERRAVGDFSCRWYDAYEETRKVREICLAGPDALGMSSEDASTMRAMQKSILAMASRMGGAGMFQDDMPDGLPVHVRHVDGGGRVTSEQRLESVSHDALDGSLFEIPVGYERREMPSLAR